MARRSLKYAGAALISAGVLAISATPANAVVPPDDPGPTVFAAGCKTVTSKAAGGIFYDWFSSTITTRWCWTKGTMATSQVYGITGDITSQANFPADVKNEKGPLNASGIAISSSTKYAKGKYADVRYRFDNRTCITGSVGLLCGPWHTETQQHRVWPKGYWTYTDLGNV